MPSDHNDLVRRVLTDHGRLAAPVLTLDDDASLYEAGLTSHASVNVMLALEDELDIEFPERFLKRSTFESIDSLCAALSELVTVDA